MVQRSSLVADIAWDDKAETLPRNGICFSTCEHPNVLITTPPSFLMALSVHENSLFLELVYRFITSIIVRPETTA